MARIALRRFGGQRPKSSAKLLGNEEAVSAVNTRLWSGNLQAFKKPKLEFVCVKSGPIKSIFNYTGGGKQAWFHFATDVDVIRAPVASDTLGRVYYTGDGKPKVTDSTYAVSVSSTLVNPQSTGDVNAVIVGAPRGFHIGDTVKFDYGFSSHFQTVTLTNVEATGSNTALTFTPALDNNIAAARPVVNTSKRYPLDAFELGVPQPPTTLSSAVNSGPGHSQGSVLHIEPFVIVHEEFEQHGQGMLGGETLQDLVDAGYLASGPESAGLVGLTKRELTFTTDGNPIEVVATASLYHWIYQASSEDLSSEFQTSLSVDLVKLDTHAEPFVLHNRFNTLSGHRTSLRAVESLPAGSHKVTFEAFWPSTLRAAGGTANTTADFNFAMAARYANRVVLKLNTGHGLVAGNRIVLTQVARINKGGSSDQDLEGKAVNVVSVNPNGDDVDEVAVDNVAPGGDYDFSNATWSQVVGTDEELLSRSYVYTYVAAFQDQEFEGGPSEPSTIVEVADGQSVTLSGFTNPTTPVLLLDTHFTAIRLYRFITGSDSVGTYRFLAEIALNATSYVDTILDNALGEPIPSLGWELPPADMRGLIELPDGGAVGFTDKEICFAVPYQLHAYPAAFRRNTHYKIVSMVAFGASIGVATEGSPYVLTGTDPSVMTSERVEIVEPCLSKRGTIDAGYAMLYPSPNGLVQISTARAEVVTGDGALNLFTPKQWQALNPASFVATRFADRYLAFYDNGTEKGGFIIDPKSESAPLVFLDLWATEAWTDPETGIVYLVQNDVIYAFDVDEAEAEYTWKSKEFTASRETAMAYAKVDAQTYPVTINFFVDREMLYSKEVVSEDMFTLPDHLTGRTWQFEIVSVHEVDAVFISDDAMKLEEGSTEL